MRQRVAIGMGLMDDPALIVADEPTTALDATVQLQVLDLLRTAVDESGAALLLVSHDLGVISHLCDRVLVMYGGRLVEVLDVADLRRAQHPYTRALVEAVPELDAPRDQPLAVIPGRPPEPDERPPGCVFAARCPRAQERCTTEAPTLSVDGPTRVACFYPIRDDEALTAVTGATTTGATATSAPTTDARAAGRATGRPTGKDRADA
jgi:oligopeptide/dipeptide ABC transporter ATP-binding protein